MLKTVALITSQYCCDRIITAARAVADENGSELLVVGIMDSEYELDPQVIEYLFNLSKQNQATMRLLFAEDKQPVIHQLVGQYSSQYIVTGMPSSNQSVLYKLWKKFPDKDFYTVDTTGELIEVMSNNFCRV